MKSMNYSFSESEKLDVLGLFGNMTYPIAHTVESP